MVQLRGVHWDKDPVGPNKKSHSSRWSDMKLEGPRKTIFINMGVY